MEVEVFSTVPAELIAVNILPYLSWNDLLRFRRTCKWAHAIIRDYLNAHPELSPEIEINEGDKSFAAFLQMGIPTTKIFLNNISGRDFFENRWEDAARFLDGYGLLVTFLRMDQISLYILERERDFLEASTSVLHFRAGRFGGYHRGLGGDWASEAADYQETLAYDFPQYYGEYVELKHHLPSFFQWLKTVEIGNNTDKLRTSWLGYQNDILQTGHSLASVSLMGLVCEDAEKPPEELLEDKLRDEASVTFMTLGFHIASRTLSGPPGTQYEIIDFVSFHGNEEETQAKLEWMWSFRFLNLCVRCLEGGVRLRNVGSNWFQEREETEEEDLMSPDLGIPVLSLVNLHPCVLSLNMPHLEGIEIRSTARSVVGDNWRGYRPQWPTLKTLHINVDSALGRIHDYEEVFEERPPSVIEGTTKDLFNFFFQDIRRVNLTELCLQFSNQNGTVELPFPNTEDIAWSCPNMKRLTLIEWPGGDVTLTKLWEGLPGLEEVTLEGCGKIGDVAFIGGDAASPAFLKLKELKKLSLKGLERMQKITDALFALVICHLNLTHLTLTSEAPINSITLAALRSLQTGSFAESIERFPFRTWSLAGVSAEEFLREEATFRSYNML